MTKPLSSDQRRAFPAAPDPRRYYAASAIEEARRRIVRAVARQEGPALVIGAAGMGKSLLLAVLAEQFEPRMSVVQLPGAQLCTRRALLQMILSELRLPYRHMDEGELRLALLEHLRGGEASQPRLAKDAEAAPRGTAEQAASVPAPRPRRILVLVDEADALPTRLLEELRVLTNLVAHGAPLVSLVLAGGPMLEERFADPQLDNFSQRLACRCYLAPLSRDETFQYVRSQVSAVGIRPETWFDADALAAIHAATGGAPRLINQLGDQLVWTIEETGCQPLDAALVQQAWSDLQQLPAPWNTDAHSSLSSSSASVGTADADVIEFGELDPPSLAPASRDESCDMADEIFVGTPFCPELALAPLDDDLPASIPIDAARRRPGDLGAYAAALDSAKELVDQLDEMDILAMTADDDAPSLAPEDPPSAENPFDEAFDDEEILVDPYADFEAQMLRGARQVVNRLDAMFAADLARHEARLSKCIAPAAPASPAARPDLARQFPVRADSPAAAVGATGSTPATEAGSAAAAAPPAPQTVKPDVLILTDDSLHAATVVSGRQFRRLFSNLESQDAARAL